MFTPERPEAIISVQPFGTGPKEARQCLVFELTGEIGLNPLHYQQMRDLVPGVLLPVDKRETEKGVTLVYDLDGKVLFSEFLLQQPCLENDRFSGLFSHLIDAVELIRANGFQPGNLQLSLDLMAVDPKSCAVSFLYVPSRQVTESDADHLAAFLLEVIPLHVPYSAHSAYFDSLLDASRDCAGLTESLLMRCAQGWEAEDNPGRKAGFFKGGPVRWMKSLLEHGATPNERKRQPSGHKNQPSDPVFKSGTMDQPSGPAFKSGTMDHPSGPAFKSGTMDQPSDPAFKSGSLAGLLTVAYGRKDIRPKDSAFREGFSGEGKAARSRISDFSETAFLLLMLSDGENREIPISMNQRNAIGRGKGKQISLAKETVSMAHAALYYESGSYFLVDEGSTNGTWHRNKKLTPHVRQKLKNGDELRFADVNCRFVIRNKGG